MKGERNRIYLMDCIIGMETLLEPGEVDVIVTSPPYNLGLPYHRYNDKAPRHEYLNWIERVAKACWRVLATKGSLFLNMGYSLKDPWIAWEVAFCFKRHFVLQNVIHWVKSIAIEKEDVGDSSLVQRDIAVGHYKPVNSPRYLHQCHEYIFHFTKNGDVELDRLAIGMPYQDKSNIGRWKSATQDRRCRGNTWFIPYPTIQSRDKERPHPAPFPVKLPILCIRLHGLDKAGLVLDPFMGLGHTALACIRLGVDYIGFEIDEYYIREANKRIQEEQARIRLPI